MPLRSRVDWSDCRGATISKNDLIVLEGLGLSVWRWDGEEHDGEPFVILVRADRRHLQSGFVGKGHIILRIDKDWNDSQILLHAGICDVELYKEGEHYDSRSAD